MRGRGTHVTPSALGGEGIVGGERREAIVFLFNVREGFEEVGEYYGRATSI